MIKINGIINTEISKHRTTLRPKLEQKKIGLSKCKISITKPTSSRNTDFGNFHQQFCSIIPVPSKYIQVLKHTATTMPLKQ